MARGVSANVAGSVIRGTAVGDVNSDGAMDLFVTSSTANRLYVNNGTGWFTNAAVASNVVFNASAFGAFFVDYDQGGCTRSCAKDPLPPSHHEGQWERVHLIGMLFMCYSLVR